MKTTKRLSIEFRHREVTIAVQGSTPHVEDSEPDAADPSTACPTCGSSWITVVARVDGDAPFHADRIHRVLEQTGLHLQVSPAGQLQICRRSFKEIKEKL